MPTGRPVMSFHRCASWALALAGLTAVAGGLGSPALSAPRPVSLASLPPECRNAVRRFGPGPGFAADGPELFIDTDGNLSLGWSSPTNAFFSTTAREAEAAQTIAKACPRLAVVVFSGPTGGTERWYIRRNGFTVRHSRDSGYPGDASKYWNWETVPFDYDPSRSY